MQPLSIGAEIFAKTQAKERQKLAPLYNTSAAEQLDALETEASASS
ncbi:unnamed protein product, partial [Scytosiphon promiscuus]